MSDTSRREQLKVSEPSESAAGVTGAANAFRHAVTRIGFADGTRTLLRLNQRDGFDCPGCAWADPLTERKTFEFCENGAKAVADEATRKRVTAEFFAKWSVDELKRQSGQWLNAQGRLAEPVYLAPGDSHYRPIAWERAYRIIADALNALDSPDRAAFYTSGRTSNEAAFLYQLFVRRYGTNNFPDCSNMCHESSGYALMESLGSGKGSVTLEDFERAQVILILGQNPGSNHPRMLATLQDAKRAGATIISVNPLDETGLKRFRNPQEVSGLVTRGTALADLKLRIRINGDVPLLKGLAKTLLARESERGGVLDHAFIERHTDGFERYREDIEHTTWDDIERGAGVGRDEIQRAADVLAGSRATIACWAMGITQHRNAVDNIQQIVNLLLLQGNLGKPGAGVCPVRGHSNVQGDRTMGIWERPSAALLDALAAEFQFEPPRHPGYNTVETLQALHAGKVDVFFAMGGNFMRATPDTHYTAAALAQCGLTVQVSTKLNKSHVYTGRSALILPALGRTDRDLQGGVPQHITTENSMGVVQPSRGNLVPDPLMKSEVRIVAELARATLGTDDPVDWEGLAGDYGRIRDHIARVIPGFEGFNARLKADGHLVLPHPVRDGLEFRTDSGKAVFRVHPTTTETAPEGHYLMTTIRTHDQFNTTVYSNNDRYRGIAGSRRVLFINPDDLAAAQLGSGDWIDITSHFNGRTRTARGFQLVAYDIPRGCTASYYPETNELIPVDAYAHGSMTPAYKSVVVSLTPAERGHG